MTIQVGNIYTSKNNGSLKILEYVNSYNVKVQFIDTGYVTSAIATHIRNGLVKDRLKPNVYGVGFIGDGKYGTSTHKHTYQCWNSMLMRCYCPKYQERNPTYKGCSVIEYWFNFQNFAKWYEDNYPNDGFKYDLDKDYLIKGNRVYSPDNCTWLTHQQNVETSKSKHYKFINPKGELVEIFNLRKFSSDNELYQSAMDQVHQGKRKSHKGWTKA